METEKKINITNQLIVNDFTSNSIEQIRNYTQNRENGSLRYLANVSLAKNVELEIDIHSFDRWNERVGPIMNSVEELVETVKFMHNFCRVRLYDKQKIGTIDNDVLFTFKYGKQGKIIITTFYGRVSLVHHLSNFEVLRKYNRTSGDNIALSHSIEVLNSQSFVTHKQIVVFEGEQHRYMLEVFDANGKDVVYISTVSGYKSGLTVEVMPDTIDLDIKLNSSGLAGLKAAGYGEFADNYQKALVARRYTVLGLGA